MRAVDQLSSEDIDREYGLGRGRTDLLITKPLTDQYGGPFQRIVLELKILRSNIE